MRRALVVLTVLGLMLLAGAALAESSSKNYLDKFSSVSYSGSDGSLQWAGPWKETREADGPSSGKVRVGEHDHCKGSKCLIIGGEELLTAGDGAYRLADLSVFEKARLSYAVGFDPDTDLLLGLTTAELIVEVTTNGGATWLIVDAVGLEAEHDPAFRSVDVSAFITSGFGVRFTMTGALGARVLVDEVEIEGSVPAPTTTTTAPSATTTSISPSTTTTTLVTLPPPTLPKLSTTSTTTTKPTTTTLPISSTTTTADLGADRSTTTIDSGETTTTVVAGAGGDDDDSGGGGDGTGLRQTSIGVGGDVPRGLFGPTPEVLSFEVTAGYANAVELIEASWVWVLGLALMIAAALIKGIDRRLDHEPAPDSEV